MTYRVQGNYMGQVDEEWEGIEQALDAARDYVREHPDAIMTISGHGIGMNVYTTKEAAKV